MTVRLAHDMGMKIVAEYAERFGVYDHLMPYLPMALGSGETTVMRMVSAYSVMANGGRQIKPSLIDRIQDRYGKTVYKHDERGCEGCVVAEWTDQAEPELIDNSDQVLDPMTAYQITSMMEGVVQRGTATTLLELNRPIAGKTGTTNDEKDAWFIGFTPNLVVGLYVGFDQPMTLGKGTTGGGLAAPIFKEFMAEALKDTPPVDFQVPEGMNIIAINRKTGMRANEGDPGTIMEAFKPGTGPGRYLLGHRHGCGRRDGRVALACGCRRHPGRRRRALLRQRARRISLILLFEHRISSRDGLPACRADALQFSGSRDGRTSGFAHFSFGRPAMAKSPPSPYLLVRASELYRQGSHPYGPRRFNQLHMMGSPIQPCARKPKNSSTKSGRA